MLSLLSRTTTLKKWLIFLFSMTYAVIVLFPNFTAQWGLIDDHGIVTVLGTEQNLRLTHIPKVIANVPEIGSVGQYPRFQPVYILLHLAEAFFFGATPFYFYAFRVLLFGFTIGLFTVLFSEMFGGLGGVILGGVFAAHQFWGDVWARLGPAEIYAAPLLAIYCFSFWRLWGDRQKRTFWYIALFLSGTALLGIKENLVFVVPATIVLVFHNWRQKFLKFPHLFLGSGVVLFGLFVVWAIGSGLHVNGGNDFYGTPVSATYRLKMMFVAFMSLANWRVEPPILLPLIISSILFLISLIGKQQRSVFSKECDILWPYHKLRMLWYGQVTLFLLWSLQVVFYFKRNIPRGEHYDFPGVLFVDFAYFLLFFICINVIRNWLVSRGKTGTGFVRSTLLVIFAIFCVVRSYDIEQIFRKSLRNSEVTQQFTRKLEHIVNEVSKQTMAPIIIESHWVWDFEPIGGLRRYLSMYGVKNPLVVKIVGYSEKSVKPGHQAVLAKEMLERSLYGDFSRDDGLAPEGTTMLVYYPISIVQPGGDCFIVSFSGDSASDCKRLGRIDF